MELATGTFQYLYDYGDGWCCIVVLESRRTDALGRLLSFACDTAWHELIVGGERRQRPCLLAIARWVPLPGYTKAVGAAGQHSGGGGGL
jgi:hypothetical protein